MHSESSENVRDEGILLWEQPPLTCRFLTHGTQPRFEMRLYTNDVLFAQKLFTDHVEAQAYALGQMRSYAAG